MVGEVRMYHLLVVTEGFHPPWTEGSRNILLGWLLALLYVKPSEVVVLTNHDPKFPLKYVHSKCSSQNRYFRLSIKRNGHIHVIFTEKALDTIRTFIYSIRPPQEHCAWRDFVELQTRYLGFYAVLNLTKTTKYILSKAKSVDALLLHNVGPYTLKFILDNNAIRNVENICISLTFTDIKRIHNLLGIVVKLSRRLNNIKFKFLTSSYYIASLLKVIQRLKVHSMNIDVKAIMPLPMIHSVLKDIDENINYVLMSNDVENYPDLLKHVKRIMEKIACRHDLITLYIGQLNEVRFPIPLLKRICSELKKCRGALTIIASPSHQSITYISRLRNLNSCYDNLYVLLYPLDLQAKEELLKYAHLVLFPCIGDVGTNVVDPPLSIIEALTLGKTVLAFDDLRLRILSKIFPCLKVVPKGDYNAFVSAIITERRDDRRCYYLRTLKPQVIGKVLADYIFNNGTLR